MSKLERDAVAFTEKWERDHHAGRETAEDEEAPAQAAMSKRELRDRLLSDRKKGDKR